MTVHVFSGPSTADSAVLEMPEVCPHPPVMHGDLYRLRLEPGDKVLIIDGLYQHEAPVRHKEILSLCASGVQVYGAASIGALRASELHGLGMPGLGTVFGWYRDGRLNSDADVAVVHGDADVGFRAFTHAMVSILDRCEELQRTGRLDAHSAAAVTEIARSVHFTERSSTALLVAARKHGQESAMRTVVTALADADSDIKRRDAATAIRALVEAGPAPLSDREIAEVPDTSLRREWMLRHSPATDAADAPTMREVLAYAQFFLSDFPERHTRYVLAHLAPEYPSLTEDRHFPRWLTGLSSAELVRRGLLNSGEIGVLSPAERNLRVLVRSFRLTSGRLVYHDLPADLADELPDLTAQCSRMLALTRQAMSANPQFHPADVPAQTIKPVFAELWRTTSLETALLDRGFRDIEDFIAWARPFYVAASAAVAMRQPTNSTTEGA
jgi:hypothetical protein